MCTTFPIFFLCYFVSVIVRLIRCISHFFNIFTAWPSHLARLAFAISKWLCSFYLKYLNFGQFIYYNRFFFYYSFIVFFYKLRAQIEIIVVVDDDDIVVVVVVLFSYLFSFSLKVLFLSVVILIFIYCIWFTMLI